MANAKEFYKFELIASDDQVVLDAKVDSADGIVKCYSAKSIGDVLLAILNQSLVMIGDTTDSAKAAIGEKLISEVSSLVDTLYINIGKDDTYILPQVRYMMHQQLRGNLNAYKIGHQNMVVRKDHSLHQHLEASPQFRDAYFQGLRETENSVAETKTNSFSVLLQAAKATNESFVNCDYYGFSTAEDLIYYLVDCTTKINQEIAKCSCCNRYFFKRRKHHEFCQHSCRQKMQNETYYCNDKELQNLYNRTYQLIARRICDDTFIYNSLPVGPLPIPSEIRLGKKEMNKVKQSFLTLNSEQRRTFIDNHMAYESQDITEEEFLSVRSKYFLFLENVYAQVKGLEKE